MQGKKDAIIVVADRLHKEPDHLIFFLSGILWFFCVFRYVPVDFFEVTSDFDKELGYLKNKWMLPKTELYNSYGK